MKPRFHASAAGLLLRHAGTACALAALCTAGWWGASALAQPRDADAVPPPPAGASAASEPAPAASQAASGAMSGSPEAAASASAPPASAARSAANAGPPAQAANSNSPVERGRYLVTAGDCIACHTVPRSPPFSGGRPVATPFGTVLSANLTPDKATGIGRYTADTFYRALHEGIDHEGHHLYPAFPYTNYTRLTREDSDAIYAYLMAQPPVQHDVDRNQLKFPFNIRLLMAGWNMLYLDKGTYKPDPNQSAEWNRGAYLVQGLGHCEACHTPRNVFGGPEKNQAFQGGRFANWFAPDITPNKRTGIGSWSREELIEFLRSGRNVHAGASGEMAEAVSFSTSQLSDGDLSAIATYLTSLPASPDATAIAPEQAVMHQGEAIWLDACASCHRSDGSGVPRAFPPIKGNANAQQRDPTTLLHYILAGAQHRPTEQAPTPFSMPTFDWKLDDGQIAAVATYARNSWGNSAAAVKAEDVARLRRELAAEQKAAAVWPPKPSPGSMAHPNPATLSNADTDSRDNGGPQAGKTAPP